MTTTKQTNENKDFQFQKFSKKQTQVLKFWEPGSPVKDRDIIIADGSIRSGKTIAMIPSFLRWASFNFSGENFIIAGKSIGALKRNIIEPMKQILNVWGWKWFHNRSENYMRVGFNTFYFFGANNEASQDVLQGLTAAGAFGDEVSLFPESFVDQMIGRCSVERSKIFLNCNPRNPFHFFKEKYIDQRREKNILYIHFTLNDNLTLAQKIKDRYKTMYAGLFYKRYILGLWVTAEGAIYDMFDKKIHVKHLPDFQADFEGVPIDYGTANPTVFMHLKYNDKDKHFHFAKEWYYSSKKTGIQRTDFEQADDLERFYTDNNLKKHFHFAIVDPSAASFITEIKKRGFRVKKANNAVLDGIRTVQSGLGNEKITFDPSCRETFKEFDTYSWDAKAQEKGLDEPIKKQDHCMDTSRYGIMTLTGRKVKAGIGINL